MRLSTYFAVLILFAVLVLTSSTLLGGCGSDDSAATRTSNPASASAEETIPFDEEGMLTVMSEGGGDVVTLQIEIAETDSARIRGMMQRESFPDETSGMLFPFPDEAPRYFHMQNTPLSLDLLFIDADSTIVSITRYARPMSAELVESGVPAQFVLETPAGFADTYGVVEGDRVRWSRTDGPQAAQTDAAQADGSPS